MVRVENKYDDPVHTDKDRPSKDQLPPPHQQQQGMLKEFQSIVSTEYNSVDPIAMDIGLLKSGTIPIAATILIGSIILSVIISLKIDVVAECGCKIGGLAYTGRYNKLISGTCESDPCYPGVSCTDDDEKHEYQCGPCKAGYTGGGIGAQGCLLIGECTDYSCYPGVECYNRTFNTFICGPCPDLYAGDGKRCKKIKCKLGWAGNGEHCFKDLDYDGVPDQKLPCSEWSCQKDNCRVTPNTDQLDKDGDGIGDACDEDYCPSTVENNGSDTDNDTVGDACDNCPKVSNIDQQDDDKDGLGDACDADSDDDGWVTEHDNCPLAANPAQTDADGDGVGDECDNCLVNQNPDQIDTDADLIGDTCDTDIDTDNDGVDDLLDNCDDVINPDQLDTDNDGKGDGCDDDKDNDGIMNVDDNCALVPNSDQLDKEPKNGIGDICETIDEDDSCPLNNQIYQADFRHFDPVDLWPDYIGTHEFAKPAWTISNQGRDIKQTVNGRPGIMVGQSRFDNVNFFGTFFVEDVVDDDAIGFIFSYISAKEFYVVTWKQTTQKWVFSEAHQTEPYASAGITLRIIHSTTGPSETLSKALWRNSTNNEMTVLWHDPTPWRARVAYRWKLYHRPTQGYMMFELYNSTHSIKSGRVEDDTYKGGRLGAYIFSQRGVKFSNLNSYCDDDLPPDA